MQIALPQPRFAAAPASAPQLCCLGKEYLAAASDRVCSNGDICERLDTFAEADAGLRMVERAGEATRDEGSGAECELLIVDV